MKKYTVFCREKCDVGTTWIETIEIPDPKDDADVISEHARTQCSHAWGMDRDNIACIGVAEGDVSILYWQDLSE